MCLIIKKIFSFESDYTGLCSSNIWPFVAWFLMYLTLCRRGSQRRVSVYKTKKKADTKKEEGNPYLNFSDEAKQVLLDLFTYYPPEDTDVLTQMVENGTEKTDKARVKKDDIFCRPSMNKAEIARKVKLFSSRIEEDPHLRQVLPLYQTALEMHSFCFGWHFLNCVLSVRLYLFLEHSYANKFEGSWQFLQVTEGRSKLPIASYKDVIVSTIESHQVL